jgi:hypothetical protein
MAISKIAQVDLATSAANITFSSIPATYTDLLVVLSGRSDYAANFVGLFVRLNGDNASNYKYRYVQGSGSAAASSNFSADSGFLAGYIDAASHTASVFGNGSIFIPNYTASAAKSISADLVEENNATEGYQAISAGLWSGTAAVTSVTILPASGNFVQYSSATLYGISKANATGASVA